MNEIITKAEFLEKLTGASDEEKSILQLRTREAFERILMGYGWSTAQEVRELYEDESENFIRLLFLQLLEVEILFDAALLEDHDWDSSELPDSVKLWTGELTPVLS